MGIVPIKLKLILHLSWPDDLISLQPPRVFTWKWPSCFHSRLGRKKLGSPQPQCGGGSIIVTGVETCHSVCCRLSGCLGSVARLQTLALNALGCSRVQFGGEFPWLWAGYAGKTTTLTVGCTDCALHAAKFNAAASRFPLMPPSVQPDRNWKTWRFRHRNGSNTKSSWGKLLLRQFQGCFGHENA